MYCFFAFDNLGSYLDKIYIQILLETFRFN